MKACANILVFLAALLALASLSDDRSVYADASKYPQYAQQSLPPDITPNFINVDALVGEIINHRTPLMIDVRSAEEFKEAHIKGSISMPLDDFARRISEIPRDRALALY
jgi:3-mercaptopyruvate sulfurtransferase SseA